MSGNTKREKWFAWYPVTVRGNLVWLAYVWRRWDWSLNGWCDMSGYSGTDGGWAYEERA